MAFDNDTAGNEGFKRTRESLLTVNKSAVVEKLNIYPDDKDLGNMEEHFLYSDSTGYNSRKEYYLSALKIIVSDNILVVVLLNKRGANIACLIGCLNLF